MKNDFGGNYPLQDLAIRPLPDLLSPLPATPAGLLKLLDEATNADLSVKTIGLLRSLARLVPAVRLAVNLKSALGYVIAEQGSEQRFGLRPDELEALQDLESTSAVSVESKRMAYGLFCRDERSRALAAVLEAAKAACSQRERCLPQSAESNKGSKT